MIPIDSIFSPVQRVRYRTENTRVGKMTNYDRLILELWTDGTITPERALVEASKIYRKHLNPFIQFFDVGQGARRPSPRRPSARPPPPLRRLPWPPLRLPRRSPRRAAARRSASARATTSPRKLELPISHMDLSVRASNCLESEGIQTIGDLVGRTTDELLAFKNFGRTSLKEIKKKLDDMELTLGMDVEAIRGGKG